MGVRRAVLVAAFASVSCVPLAAWAQGAVVVAPIAPVASAPALGLPLLVTLVVILVVSAYFALRRVPAQSLSVFVGVAMAAVVAVAYATGVSFVDISGPDCTEQTAHPFNPTFPNDLRNQCSNPMQVIELINNCGAVGSETPESEMPPPIQSCTVGTVLNSGEQCHLFMCA